MSTAYVHGIINSSQASFKMASPIDARGHIDFGPPYAVGGIVGQRPHTMPVSLHLSDPARKVDKQYAVEMVNDPIFAPIFLYEYAVFHGASGLADFFASQGYFYAEGGYLH